jgi:hypothetical protein
VPSKSGGYLSVLPRFKIFIKLIMIINSLSIKAFLVIVCTISVITGVVGGVLIVEGPNDGITKLGDISQILLAVFAAIGLWQLIQNKEDHFLRRKTETLDLVRDQLNTFHNQILMDLNSKLNKATEKLGANHHALLEPREDSIPYSFTVTGIRSYLAALSEDSQQRKTIENYVVDIMQNSQSAYHAQTHLLNSLEILSANIILGDLQSHQGFDPIKRTYIQIVEMNAAALAVQVLLNGNSFENTIYLYSTWKTEVGDCSFISSLIKAQKAVQADNAKRTQ